jgi:hypothetical protein
LTHHEVRTTAQEGWDTLRNGELLTIAEATLDVFVTCDQNSAQQQNLRGRRIAIVSVDTNAWPVIGKAPELVVRAIDRVTPGSFQTVNYPRPKLRRRPYAPPS